MVLVVRCSLCGDILECSKSNRQVLFDHIREKHPKIALDSCQHPSKESKLGADSKCVLNEIMHEDELDEVGVEVGEEGKNKGGGVKRDTFVVDKKHVSISSPNNGLSPKQSDMQCSKGSGKRPKGSKNNNTEVLYEREYKCKKPLVQHDLNKKKKIKNPKLYRTTVEKWRPGISKIYCPKCGETRTPIIKATQNRVSKSSAGAACILTCWPFCFLPFLFPPPTHENLYCRACDFFLGIYDHQNDKAQPNGDVVCAR